MHNGSFPSVPEENTGFGSINSSTGHKFIDYASGLFDAIQMGPAGKTKGCDASPYTGTIFSNNPLFIDLEQLTTDEWFNLLSKETYEKICENNPKKDLKRTAYSYIYAAQDEALREVYENFKKVNPFKLVEAFEKYKKDIGIYKITNIVNGFVYIGQTTQGFQKRYWMHQWHLRKGKHDNQHLQNAWNLYGENNFQFSVVEISSKEKIDERAEQLKGAKQSEDFK